MPLLLIVHGGPAGAWPTLRGVTVRMIVFPRQHHGLAEPKMRVKAAQSSVEWIEKWISR